jgi:hypothetical protein
MATIDSHTFTADEVWESEVNVPYPRIAVMAISGERGGGTMTLRSILHGQSHRIPNGTVAPDQVDAQGNPVDMVYFQAIGRIAVEMSGAAGANCTVHIYALDAED